MDQLLVEGGNSLSGSVEISTSKNAILPILAGVLLNKKKIRIQKIPQFKDVDSMVLLLESLGVKKTIPETNVFEFDACNIESTVADYDLVRKMRASILVLGPLLSRFKEAKVSLPGGCAIGARPIDIHLEGLKKMGAEISIEGGYVHAKTNGLKGEKVVLPFPSVGATENLMMAAVFASGITTIENAAKEPEIIDLANFLISQGVRIEGAGSANIIIHGKENGELVETNYCPIGDRIEAGTFLAAAFITKSTLEINGINPTFLDPIIDPLKSVGAEFDLRENGLTVYGKELNKGLKLTTSPHPGFPTDLQAQLMALSCFINDTSTITETIFENRFMHVPELKRMGADIELKSNTAIVKGGKPLTAAPVMCTDLRASACLVLAALGAKGETKIKRVYHLDRGYENIEVKLSKLGAKIRRVKGD